MILRTQPLDLPSEAIFAWEHGPYSQTDFVAYQLAGNVDQGAMAAAVIDAGRSRPTYSAYLTPEGPGPWKRFFWHFTDQPNELIVRDYRDLPEGPKDPCEWMYENLAPETAHRQELATEFPVRFILLLLPGDLNFIVIVFHHVAADAANVYECARDIFAGYHLRMTGESPEWEKVPGLHAQAGKIEPVTAVSFRNMLRRELPQARRYPLHKAQPPVARPEPGKFGRIVVRHVIDDPVEQKALRDRARRDGGSLTDLCCAASKRTVEQWNRELGIDTGCMFHGIAVNQRLRRRPEEIAGQGNPMGLIMVPSAPEDRTDPDALLRHVIGQRKMRIGLGYDVTVARFTQNLLRLGRALPLPARYAFLRKILDMRTSHFITNLGIVWPRLENGRPTGDTAIEQVGNLELTDIFPSVGTTEKNPSVMILRTFRNKLFIIMIYGQWGFCQEDAKAISALHAKNISAYL